MPQIMPWWCPHTDKMFSTKEKYVIHVKNMARERFENRKIIRRVNQAKEIIKTVTKVSTIAELEEFFKEHAYEFYMNAYGEYYSLHHRHGHRYVKPPCKTWKIIDIRIAYAGVGNSDGKKHMNCTMFIHHEHSNDGYETSFILDETPIVSGSGGGTHISDTEAKYKTRIKLYEDNWPNLFVMGKMMEEN